MEDILKILYDSFYVPPELAELKREIEDNHQLLIERLEKPERKLILRIIDAKDSVAGALSLDSFICGFKLAWRLANELNNYKDERSAMAKRPQSDARLSLHEEKTN